MDPDHPPDIDAEFRVVHGPWPRWVLQMSLVRLALRTAAIVALLCVVSIAIALVIVGRG